MEASFTNVPTNTLPSSIQHKICTFEKFLKVMVYLDRTLFGYFECVVGDPPGGRGYVAILPTCGPSLILPAALKPWGPPRRQGLCSHLAHLWPTSESAPHSEAASKLCAPSDLRQTS